MNTSETASNATGKPAPNDTSAVKDNPSHRFETPRELHEAHGKLLDISDSDDLGDELPFAEFEEFIRRAAATGELLESEAERLECQGMIDYWAAFLYRKGRGTPGTRLAPFNSLAAPELPDEAFPYGERLGGEAGHDFRYFGWERFLKDCFAKLRENKLLGLVGAPGSGRSSFLRHALIPELQEGKIPGSESWCCLATFRPGSEPLSALAAAVLGPSAGQQEVGAEAARLRRSEDRLAELLDSRGRACLMIVDRFEELLRCDPQERDAFAANLYGAVRAAEHPHRAVLLVSVECLSQLSQFGPLEHLFQPGQVFFSFTAPELRRTVEEPAHRVGLKFDKGLLERIILSVQGDPAAISLLQFTLARLWPWRERNRITWAAYERCGAGAVALECAAEELYLQLGSSPDADLQKVLRDVLLQMIRLDTIRNATSIACASDRLFALPYPKDDITHVLQGLEEAGLARRDEHTGCYCIAHEGLLNYWPRLQAWMEEASFARRLRIRLRNQAEEWFEKGRCPDLLWRGMLLQDAANLDDLDYREREFLAASRRRERNARIRVWGAAVLFLAGIFGATLLYLHMASQANKRQLSAMKLGEAVDALARLDFLAARMWLHDRGGEPSDLETLHHWIWPDHRRREAWDHDWDADREAIARVQSPELSYLVPSQPVGASSSTGDGNLPKWSFIAHAVTKTMEPAWVVAVAEEGNKRRLIAYRDGTVYPLDKFLKADDPVAVAFAGDGRYLVVGCKSPGSPLRWCDLGSLNKNGNPAFQEIADGGETLGKDFSIANGGLQIAGETDREVLLAVESMEEGGLKRGGLRTWKLDRSDDGFQLAEPLTFQSTGKTEIQHVHIAKLSPDGQWLATVLVIREGYPSAEGARKLVVWQRHKDVWIPVPAPEWVHRKDPGYFKTWGWAPSKKDEDKPGWTALDTFVRALAFRQPDDEDQRVQKARYGLELMTCADDGTLNFWKVQPSSDSTNDSTAAGGQGKATVSVELLADMANRIELGVSAYGASFPSRDTLITCGRDRFVRFWDVNSRAEVSPSIHHEGTVNDARMCGDRHLFTITAGYIRYWKLPARTTASLGPPTTHLELRGNRLAMYTDERHSGKFLEGRVEVVTPTAASSTGTYDTVALDSAGVLVAAARSSGDSREPEIHVFTQGTSRKMNLDLKGMEGKKRQITRVRSLLQTSTDPPLLLISGECRLLEGDETRGFTAIVKDGAAEISGWVPLEKAGLYATVCQDGSLLATCDVNNKTKVWKIESILRDGPRQAVPIAQLEHTSDVVRASFSPQSKKGKWSIVTVSSSGEAAFWKSDNPALVERDNSRNSDGVETPRSTTPDLRLVHDARVFSAEFDPTGRRIVTASQDRTAKVWGALHRPRSVNGPVKPEVNLLGTLCHQHSVKHAWFLPVQPASDDRQAASDDHDPRMFEVLTVVQEPENLKAQLWQFRARDGDLDPRQRIARKQLVAARKVEQLIAARKIDEGMQLVHLSGNKIRELHAELSKLAKETKTAETKKAPVLLSWGDREPPAASRQAK